MEVISEQSNRVSGGDDVATVHSLRSLVSSDDSIHSLDQYISSSNRQSSQECQDHRHRFSGTEISIIACSSPEIKALVQPIPPSIQYQHQRSISTLTFFPEASIDDQCCDSVIFPVTKMQPVVPPTVSPDNGHIKVNGKMKFEGFKPHCFFRFQVSQT